MLWPSKVKMKKCVLIVVMCEGEETKDVATG